LAADKLLTMWTLAAARVAVPRHASASQFGSAAEAIAWGEGAVVVKPRVSRGGRGVVVVEDPDDLDWSQVGAGQIVQEFAPGTEFAPQTYRSPHTGEAHSHILRKTALKEGRVGNAAEAVRVPDGTLPELERLAISTLEALGLTGPVDMDVRLDRRGEPVVLEVNSRFGALSALAPELLSAVLEDHLPR
jgi:carbamoyl-phosphate synthase large subunit